MFFFYLNNNLSKLKQRPESAICGCETEMTQVERFSGIGEVWNSPNNINL